MFDRIPSAIPSPPPAPQPAAPARGLLTAALEDGLQALAHARRSCPAELNLREVGTVTFIGQGIAHVAGLPGVESEELVQFAGDQFGLALNVEEHEVGVILLDSDRGLAVGTEVRRTGRVLDVPVGDELIGRVVDALGRPLDGRGALSTGRRWPIEREAPAIIDRAPVTVPLQTGIKVIDALVPVGRGQRQLILGDRQTGKTAIALDTILNQKGQGVFCIYCAIGQRNSAVAGVLADLRSTGAIDYTLVLVATGQDPPGLRYICPYAAMTMGEYLMEQGRDVLIVFDDLTRHARAYRELSLILRRPPGREAYPGDIFYIHSRLLERSTHLMPARGGGSLTALPIVETESQDLSAYIPTNLISITDGQIYLSPTLFQKSLLPAVDVGKSVSRVGGKTQLPAYRSVAGDLRLAYSQFEELEAFARFGTRLDDATRRTLDHGRRVREIIKQTQFNPLPAPEQIAALFAVARGYFDALPLAAVAAGERAIQRAVREELGDLSARMLAGDELRPEDIQQLARTVQTALVAASVAAQASPAPATHPQPG